jgi:hypothetical protein
VYTTKGFRGFGAKTDKTDQIDIKTANSEQAVLHFDKRNIYVHERVIKMKLDGRKKVRAQQSEERKFHLGT